MLQAIDEMKSENIQRAYCFSLGGHHAYRDWGHGYCILNPTAAAVRYAQRQGYQKILIIDWDVHHGDGTNPYFRMMPAYTVSVYTAPPIYIWL
jgi:acetoin utilization deacetylase AcuC-like enzyme